MLISPQLHFRIYLLTADCNLKPIAVKYMFHKCMPVTSSPPPLEDTLEVGENTCGEQISRLDLYLNFS